MKSCDSKLKKLEKHIAATRLDKFQRIEIYKQLTNNYGNGLSKFGYEIDFSIINDLVAELDGDPDIALRMSLQEWYKVIQDRLNIEIRK